jgi:nucleotide-binding universal stress UspA family protein
MSRQCARFSPYGMKILIAYDGSEFAKAILDDLPYAGLPSHAEVAVITLAEPEYHLVGRKTDSVMGWLSCRLIEARMSARLARDYIQAKFPGWDVTFEARLAPPTQEIVRKVVEWNPDLAIIGQHGRGGLKRAGLGRVAKEIMAGSPATDVIEAARRWRADCVFIGAEETSLIERVFCGDFVASVASGAECSVEVVRGPVRRGAEISEGAALARHKDFLPVAS